MRREIEEIPVAVARFLEGSAPVLAEAAERIRRFDPLFVATVARGSSDHAAAYFKYIVELEAGLPVASIGPSVVSIYGRQLRLSGALVVAISQSGQSPDIVAMATSAKAGGALSIALTNTPSSPLAEAVDVTVDLFAGPERSVAATKTFVNSVTAGLALLAFWRDDPALHTALRNLPDVLARAVECDWSDLIEALSGAESLFVLGRGPSAAIAAESALKFKETAGLHAEAFSAAEVAHGPKAIVGARCPVLALAARDAAEASVLESAEALVKQGANVFVSSSRPGAATGLPFAPADHPLVDALPLAVSFYAFVEAFARHRGFDPDNPPNLRKVTETK